MLPIRSWTIAYKTTVIIGIILILGVIIGGIKYNSQVEKVKRSPSLRSGHQPKQGFQVRNPQQNTIHPAGLLRPWHSDSWVNYQNRAQKRIVPKI